MHAHPDDESSKGAASTAKYVAEGVRVMVATCTGGERGSILNPKMDLPEVRADITAVRRAEMAEAIRILGVEHVWLGFVDSGFPEGDPPPPLPDGCFALTDPEESCLPLVEVIRSFRPQVMTTYDESGGYPHPDHVMCHKVSMAAYRMAARDVHPELGPPWRVAKLYYQMSFHRRRFASLDQALHDHGMDEIYADRLAAWEEDAEFESRLTTFVPCAEHFPTRDAALKAHATQVDPDGPWFAVPLAIQQVGWPSEDFQLVESTVPTRIPEDDLFAGLRHSSASEG